MAIFIGNGVVWDKDNNKVLCTFVNGEFKTSEQSIIEKLQILGYDGFRDELDIQENIQAEQVEEKINHIPEVEKMVEAEQYEEKKEETVAKEAPKKARR